MSRGIIEEYPYVHDNEILSYKVDICNKELQLFTQYYNEEKTLITFTGLKGHRFENVTYRNIIMGITQISIDCFIDENRELVEKGLRSAFPIAANSCEELQAYLEKNEQKIFEISSVLGLNGFVIAKEISIDKRDI